MALINDEEGKIPGTLDLSGSFLDAATIAKLAVFGNAISLWKTTHPVYPASCFYYCRQVKCSCGKLVRELFTVPRFQQHFNMLAAEDNKFRRCLVYLHAPR